MGKGRFITFEGPEGVGKTTQVKRISEAFNRLNIPFIAVREPGSTKIGDQIRSLLLDPQFQMMTIKTEMLLFAAARAQLIEEVIRPALDAGKVVLCDRFVDSSIAYQAFGAGAKFDDVLQVNQIAIAGCLPDRTYLLDVSVSKSRERLSKRGQQLDRQEAKEQDFHQRVRDGYLQLAAKQPQRFVKIAADQSREQVFSMIWSDLEAQISHLL
ncbi:dTMP kinase [Seinonella peptonophila]|uniref:Thymidylate kinase n=1 Tax=Seinonella peptonophila TaxID=112248 RepID=A0A1M4YKA2_9BACL|nr:dTMP kinase [Seinonella peptonophila]SHF06234.1 dTMP kinase [Seinonella peptonophila]